MGISVEMFCKTFKANTKAKPETMKAFLNKHVTRTYVPYVEKIAICTNIVECTTHKTVDDRKIVFVNTPMRYILFIMNLIKTYTDIDINFNDGHYLEDYDALQKEGVIQALIGGESAPIPLSEYEEFSTILNMILDDFRDNEYSLTAMLYNFKESLHISEDVINSVVEELSKQQ